jgi:hypothetical protein
MIKAIETRYKGYHFRSRLEARWAVFFDHLGLRWQFEPEGFDLSEYGLGYYLPDFFLPDQNYWIEVKPDNFDHRDQDAYRKLAYVGAATDARGLLVAGEPYHNVVMGNFEDYMAPGVLPYDQWWTVDTYYREEGDEMNRAGQMDGPYLFCVCPLCDKIGIEFDGRGDRVCGDICRPKRTREKALALGFWGGLYHGDKAYSGNHPKIVAAAEAARSARFEHGQSGAS